MLASRLLAIGRVRHLSQIFHRWTFVAVKKLAKFAGKIAASTSEEEVENFVLGFALQEAIESDQRPVEANSEDGEELEGAKDIAELAEKALG